MTLDELKRPGVEAVSLARRFLEWWGAELEALVPEMLTRAGRAGRAQFLLLIEGTDLVTYRCEAGAASEVARCPCDPWDEPDPAFLAILKHAHDPIILRLPIDRVLHRPVVLPGAARENLREVLGFEMDRQTPFNVDDVYYDFNLVDKVRSDGQLLVDLVVAPRRTVDEWVRRLDHLGVRLTAVTAENAGEQGPVCAEPRVNLLPSQAPAKVARRSAKRLNTALALGVGVLAVVALTLPLVKMHGAQARLQEAASAAQAEAREVQELRELLQTEVRHAEMIATRKQAKPPLIELLAELARILPDDTWLNTVNLQAGKLNIHGESKIASQLIGLLESSPLLAEPAFVSSVIPNPVTGYERFQISMTLSSGG